MGAGADGSHNLVSVGPRAIKVHVPFFRNFEKPIGLTLKVENAHAVQSGLPPDILKRKKRAIVVGQNPESMNVIEVLKAQERNRVASPCRNQ